MLRAVLLDRPLLSLRRGLWRRRVLLLRLTLLDRSLLSSRWDLWRRLGLSLRGLRAGLGLLGVLSDRGVRARCLRPSGSRRW